MSNSLTTTKQSDQELIAVLQSSLYPGATIGSVQMVLNYCVAAGLDPMQKPVHIVPIWDSKAKVMRDVVMPGIGLYRTQAARSGQYAGVTEPEFGDDVTETLDGVKVTFPKWCKVTVRRLLSNGTVVDFTAKELWLENYATAKRDSTAPNSMWKRRPYAQLAKCAEAQALRKAFPEFGSQPTADEMEGKEFDGGQPAERDITQSSSVADKQTELPKYPDDSFAENLPTWRNLIKSGKATADQLIARSSTKYTLTEQQKSSLRAPFEPEANDPIDADFVKSFEGAEHEAT